MSLTNLENIVMDNKAKFSKPQNSQNYQQGDIALKKKKKQTQIQWQAY